MTPGCDLVRCQPQTGQLQGHWVHADFRIEQRVDVPGTDCCDRLDQRPISTVDQPSVRVRNRSRRGLRLTEAEYADVDACAVQLFEPALEDRPVHRLLKQ